MGSINTGRGYVKVAGGGGAMGSGRPAGVPSLVSARPANAVDYFEDFNYFNVGPATASGHPEWLHTVIGSPASGTVGGFNTTATNCFGILDMRTGATSGDGVLVEATGRTTTGVQGVPAVHTAGTAWNAVFRFQHSSVATARRYGYGLILVKPTANGPFWAGSGAGSAAQPTTALATSHRLSSHAVIFFMVIPQT